MKYIFLLLLLFSYLKAEIIETSSIDQLYPFVTKDTLILFDLDNTLIDTDQPLGAKPWRDWVRNEVRDLEMSQQPPKLLIAKHLTNLARFAVPMVPLEGKKTLDFINFLKTNAIPFVVLTARPVDFLNQEPYGSAKLTLRQLKSSGIRIPVFEKLPSYEGVLFTCEQNKGTALKAALEKNNYFPKRILFLDNGISNISSVEQAVEELGIEYFGFHYSYTNPRWENWDPLVANLQLEAFIHEGRVPNESELLPLKENLNANSHFKTLILNSYLQIIEKSFSAIRSL